MQNLVSYHAARDRAEKIAGAVVSVLIGGALFAGMLACMLSYFDVLTK